jgi:hypothetical protein
MEVVVTDQTRSQGGQGQDDRQQRQTHGHEPVTKKAVCRHRSFKQET